MCVRSYIDNYIYIKIITYNISFRIRISLQVTDTDSNPAILSIDLSACQQIKCTRGKKFLR